MRHEPTEFQHDSGTVVSIRLPPAVAYHVENIVLALEARMPGVAVSRADAMRVAATDWAKAHAAEIAAAWDVRMENIEDYQANRARVRAVKGAKK